jgi:DNA polymerase III delta subunit
MTPTQVRAAIARGETAPIYLLESEDAPSRHGLAQAFLALVEDGLHAFNVAVFHGRDASNAGDREAMLGDILGAARTLPMMAPRRVVLVYDAEALLAPRRSRDEEPVETSAKGRGRSQTAAELFEAYVAAPEPMTTLVLATASLDKGRRVTKLLHQHGVVVDCGTLDSVEDAARWIRDRLEADEMTMEPAAVRALVEATGLHLPRVRAEVDKLVLYATGAAAITAAHVREVVTAVDAPGENFALGKAIWAGETAAALREVHALIDAGMPPPMVLGQVRAAVIRLRPDERARAALRRVLEADLAVKSSRGEPQYVLETLVVAVCGAAGPPGGAARRPWA